MGSRQQELEQPEHSQLGIGCASFSPRQPECVQLIPVMEKSGKLIEFRQVQALILYVLLLPQLKLSLQRGGRAGVLSATVLRESSGLRRGGMEKGTAGTTAWSLVGQHPDGMRCWSKHSATARRQTLTSKGKEIPPERGRTSLGFLGHGHTSGVSIRPKCPGTGGQPLIFRVYKGCHLLE